MKGKSGNLILRLKEDDSIEVDGPARIYIKKTQTGRAVIMIDANDETSIKANILKAKAKECVDEK